MSYEGLIAGPEIDSIGKESISHLIFDCGSFEMVESIHLLKIHLVNADNQLVRATTPDSGVHYFRGYQEALNEWKAVRPTLPIPKKLSDTFHLTYTLTIDT